MSRMLLIIALIINVVNLFGQDYFEGIIIYQQELENVDSVTAESLKVFLGLEQHYYINDSNYKAYNEKGVLKQLYNSSSNNYYFVNPQNHDVMVIDAKENTSELVSIEKLMEVDSILNYLCNKIVIKTKSDRTTYWYSPTVKVPHQNFIQHNYGNWGILLKETEGALPLKFVTESPNFTLIATATFVEKQELKDSEFDIYSMLEK